MKNKAIFFSITALILFLTAAGEVFAGAEQLCPLPKEYKVEMDGQVKENADPGCGIGDSTHKKNVPDGGLNGTQQAKFVIDEDVKHQFGFKAFPGSVLPSKIEGCDSTTHDEYIDWMPNLDDYHPLDLDKSPVLGAQMESVSSCYTFKGINTSGVKWPDGQGWKVNKVHHTYHMDSPTKYGDCGCIGYNYTPAGSISESLSDGGADGKSIFEYAYAEPSVPLWFVASSVLSITWDWDYQYQHCWEINHGDWIYDTYGNKVLCGKCMQPAVACEAENAMSPYWTPPAKCKGTVTNWPPSKFYTDIQKPSVATARKGQPLYYAEQGVPGTIYSVPSEPFTLPNEPVVVARGTIRVKDTSNVAHVQIGLKSGNTNLLKAECGKKISDTTTEKIVIRIVDNAVHASKSTVVDAGEKTCVDGDWDENNFKAIFWYEMPLYQYASYLGDKWKDAGGVEKPLIEVVYSPMFVWKKHTICTKLSDFFQNGGTSKSLYHNHSENGGKNPVYIIYEKEMTIADLFKSDDDGQEDIMPWHYATTAMGDGFGNPPYSKDVANDLYDYSKDMNNGSIVSKFKYKPMNFTKGKGPLKYFLEVRDGSTLTKGGARKSEEQKFDCSETYFKDDKYEQGQLKYNPEVVKYMQYSSSSADLSPGAQVDPTQNPNQNALAEEYDKTTKVWAENPDLTNPLNANVDSGAEIVKHFQAWGRVEIKDTIKPNAGLKIIDTTRGTIRKVYKINDLTTLACYKDLSSGEGKNWALVDTDKHNHKLVSGAKSPRAPFTLNADNEKLWEFKDVQLLINTSPDSGRIWEGKDFEGTFPDAMQDSMAPYGTAEDTKLEITHQDLRNDTKKSNFVTWYAHDNIDGQRVKKDTNQVKKEDWYKGLTALDFDSDNERNPEFPDDFISKGYSSWLIKDETYADVSVFNQMYKNGSFYKYPDLSFNNPNRKWDGSALPNGDKEISVAYGVVDQAGNKRKLKLWFYVGPLDMKIMTIEKSEKRTE